MPSYNPNKTKIHRSYTFEEVANLYGVHKNTVSRWIKDGLPCLKERRPYLILGTDLKSFLQNRYKARKHKCGIDEMFCVSCRKPAKPALNFVEYVPFSESKGRLVGLCCDCGSITNKFVGLDWLVANPTIFDVSLPKALEHIRDPGKATSNSDFNR